ncbi:uncharacterized protein LOC129000440 [Macrosteles quadrilineatus]|uniref:uncharacterized protein LOC129000440 n=1 Tax=Macrosteles quadrilineatus TaxID=74068 RepID=UPI0023E32038|nr:uncharacterized protein LOC129000440 [Macrosteles quadrilineatus]
MDNINLVNNKEFSVKNTSKDLGVYWNSSLTPEHHVDEICRRACGILGLIFRVSRNGFSITTLTTLYKTLLRPILEYASVVWKPYHDIYVSRLQRIQRRFARMMGVRCGYNYRDVPVEELESLLNLHTLAKRRDVADLAFLLKLINGKIDSPQLLEKLLFRVPGSTRSTDVFFRAQYRTNYLGNSPMIRLQRLGNEFSTHVDLYSDSLASLKHKILHV